MLPWVKNSLALGSWQEVNTKLCCQMLCDAVPVDTCANLTLVAAWETHRAYSEGRKDVKVYSEAGCSRQLYNTWMFLTIVQQ